MNLLSSLFTALRLATPLSFTALGGYLSERAGIVNIGLEGMMLMGSFCAAVIALATHNPWLGILGGISGGIAMALIHAFLCVKMRADQIISGMAVNLLALGIPPVVCKALYDMSGGTPTLTSTERLQPFFVGLFPSGISPLVSLSFITVILLYFMHSRSRFGQYVRFAGEHPLALESQGVSVEKIRTIALIGCGGLCGLAGAYLSIEHGSGFARNMTAGRGFIALAALILGRWTPQGAFISALLFGVIETLQMLLQGIMMSDGTPVPVQWIQMLPYIATLVILAGFISSKKAGILIPVLLPGLFFTGCKLNPEPPPPIIPLVEKQKPNTKPEMMAEFIKEMYQVVLLREVTKEEFESHMNVLEQGAHFEGVYNGLIYTKEYSDKEKGLAPARAVKLYVAIMAEITLAQKYDSQIQEAIKKHDKPDVPKPHDETFKIQRPSEFERLDLQSQFEKAVLDKGYSTYFLKKKLGEEILHTVDLKKAYREKLATWYGSFTVFLNKMGVDFGLQQRSNTNEIFNYKWALYAQEDRIKWECLNRVHRVINSSQ